MEKVIIRPSIPSLAVPTQSVPELDFDPDSEEMREWWYSELVKWFGELDVHRMETFSKYTSAYRTQGVPDERAEICALKQIAEDIYLLENKPIPESVKARFRIGKGGSREKFLTSLTGAEHLLYDHKAMQFFAECSKRSLPVSWLDAERYAAACVVIRRKNPVQESIKLFKVKKDEFITDIAKKGKTGQEEKARVA